MSLLLEVPEAVEAPVAEPARRPRSPLPLVALLCVLTGLAVSLVLSAPGLASFAALRPSATGAPWVTVPEYGPKGSYVLGYEHGATARLSLSVTNDGPLPIRITSLDLGGGPAPLLAVRGFEGLPLSLGRGETGAVTAVVAMVNCRYFNERQMQVYDDVRVGFDTLGRSGTRTLAYDRPILVKSPMIVSCPDRLLDRAANRPGDLL